MLRAQCPTHDALRGFLQGKCSAEQASSIGEHLDTCRSCRTLIDTIDDDLPSSSKSATQDGLAAASARARPDELVRDSSGAVVEDAARSMGNIGQYTLLAKLGEGGMGTVYKALHTRLEKTVALKVLPESRMRDQTAVERFDREMRAVGKLEHPNIVRATDAGEANGVHYLVMEYVEGFDLSALARRTGPIPVADACELIRQAAVGLQVAYESGMVHRDIKLANMMLSRARPHDQPPIVKILDLGLALLDEQDSERPELTSTGQMMGTLDYMAPEQTDDSHEVDIRADVYSLGVSLFRLLTNESPFSSKKYKTPLKRMMAKASEPAPSVATKREDLPAGLVIAVDRMLAKEPVDRFATPAEVATALAAFTGDADLALLLEKADNAADAENSSVTTELYTNSVTQDTSLGGLNAKTIVNGQDHRAPQPVKPRTQRLTRISLAMILVFAVVAAIVVRVQTGNEPPGTMVGGASSNLESATSSVAATPPPSYGLEFDGESSFVDMPAVKYDGSHAITIEAILELDADRTVHFVSDIQSGGVGLLYQAHHWQFVAGFEQAYAKASALRESEDGQRVSLAGVRDGNQVRLFVDGTLVSEVEGQAEFSPSPFHLVLGANPQGDLANPGTDPNWGQHFYQIHIGRMYGLRISKVARYSESYAPTNKFTADEDTWVLYHFDEGQGDRLIDSSGNEHHGTIVGAKWVLETSARE